MVIISKGITASPVAGTTPTPTAADPNVAGGPFTVALDPNADATDSTLCSTIEHEFGHILGLDEEPDTRISSIMGPVQKFLNPLGILQTVNVNGATLPVWQNETTNIQPNDVDSVNFSANQQASCNGVYDVSRPIVVISGGAGIGASPIEDDSSGFAYIVGISSIDPGWVYTYLNSSPEQVTVTIVPGNYAVLDSAGNTVGTYYNPGTVPDPSNPPAVDTENGDGNNGGDTSGDGSGNGDTGNDGGGGGGTNDNCDFTINPCCSVY